MIFILHNHSHRTVTAMNVSAFSVNFLQLVITNTIPVIHIPVALAVLKISNHNGCLTEVQLRGCRYAFHAFNGYRYGALQILGSVFFALRGKEEAVVSTELGVGGFKVKCLGIQHDGVDATVNSTDENQFHGLAERNGDDGLLEFDFFGNNDLNRMFTDNVAVVNHLNGNGTYRAVGNEYAVFDRTHSAFLDLPDDVFGDFSLGAGKVGADHAELDFAAGSVVIVIAGDVCSYELTGGGSGGNNENTAGGRSLDTVGGRAVDLQLFAGTLREVCRGAAAVAAYCVNTAKSDHCFSNLVNAHTAGIRSLTSVVLHDDDRTVCLDTEDGLGALIFMAHGSGVLTVLDDKAEVAGDNLFFPSGNTVGGGAHFDLGHIRRSCHAVLFVKVDDKTGIRDGVVRIYGTVDDEDTERFTLEVGVLLIVLRIIPGKTGIHSTNNIESEILLYPSRLLTHGAGLIVSERGIHTHIAGKNGSVRIVDIYFHHVHNLTAVAAAVIQNDFGFNDTGSDIPFVLSDNVVIAVTGNTMFKRAFREEAHGGNAAFGAGLIIYCRLIVVCRRVEIFLFRNGRLKGMRDLCSNVIHVGRAAELTSIGRITFLATGRRRYRAAVVIVRMIAFGDCPLCVQRHFSDIAEYVSLAGCVYLSGAVSIFRPAEELRAEVAGFGSGKDNDRIGVCLYRIDLFCLFQLHIEYERVGIGVDRHGFNVTGESERLHVARITVTDILGVDHVVVQMLTFVLDRGRVRAAVAAERQIADLCAVQPVTENAVCAAELIRMILRGIVICRHICLEVFFRYHQIPIIIGAADRTLLHQHKVAVCSHVNVVALREELVFTEQHLGRCTVGNAHRDLKAPSLGGFQFNCFFKLHSNAACAHDAVCNGHRTVSGRSRAIMVGRNQGDGIGNIAGNSSTVFKIPTVPGIISFVDRAAVRTYTLLIYVNAVTAFKRFPNAIQRYGSKALYLVNVAGLVQGTAAVVVFGPADKLRAVIAVIRLGKNDLVAGVCTDRGHTCNRVKTDGEAELTAACVNAELLHGSSQCLRG